MSYSESLQKIREARADRDAVKEQLYHLQLKYLSLKKQQKKAEGKEIADDKATSELIDSLQKEIAGLREQLNNLTTQLNRLLLLNDRIKELQLQLQQLTAETEQIKNKIAGIDNELQHGDISDAKKAELEKQKEALKEQLGALDKKKEKIDEEIKKIRTELANTPSQDDLQNQIQELNGRIKGLQEHLDTAIKDNTKFVSDNSGELERIRSQIFDAIDTSKEKNQVLISTIGELFGRLTPQQLIEEWNDNIPILLLPLRLETKFKQEGDINELWVRIFPDDIAVVTHEKVLTDTEITYGTAHWKAIWKAKGDAAKKQTAWQMITDKFGLNRAAWVALQTKTTNWDNAGDLASEDDLVFPTFDITKPDSWTQAPHTRIMPDRFVIMGYRASELRYSAIGNQVDDILILGPAPVEDADNPSLTRDSNDNRIKYSDDFKWLVDFDTAVEKGMGFKIPLDNESAISGFDQLLVLGIKLSADENDSQQIFEDLLQNHRYSIEGLSLIQQGTPTNNTDEEDTGYSKKQTIEDISKFIEQDQVLFNPTADLREATDGQRLADYLGVEYEIFQTVQNSQLRDHTEAIAMNKALYAATLGYYMHSMLNDVVDDHGLLQLRSHFTNLVTGRGTLAAIRVGSQPYGIIVTSAFDQWKYPQSRIFDALFSNSFYEKLYTFLKFLQGEWQNKISSLAHISKQGDANDNLMKVLGLHPNSVEFYQRVGYSWDYLQNLDEFGWGGKYFGDVMKMVFENIYVRQLLRNFGYTETNDNGTSKAVPLLLQLIFQHYQTRLDNKNLIDGEPLSENQQIKPYDEATGLNYIDWLIANAGDATQLEKQDFGGAPKPNSLLYLMLLYSLLHEASESIYTYLNRNDIVANELLRSRKFMNISSAPTVSHWEVFQAPVNKLVTTEESSLPLYSFIYSQINIGTSDFAANLAEHLWGLNILKDLPTARLERILVEHIDTVSYRLDSWQTSLFEQRLQSQRNLTTDNTKRTKGIYLGAYGYLENVQPGHKRTKISEDILPESLRENKDNLFVEAGNGGYVHAPSLNHATAAAILRNGYLTHANAEDQETLSVNLSSERVRRAKYLLEGIQNGQTLEALLGYQFERGLHDWTTRPVNPVILNQLIPNFRDAFPITKTKVPQEGKTTGPEEVTQDFHVVNGLALANVTSDFPYGISTFPTLDNDQINAIRTEKKEIEDTLDALRDVLLSEGAYQLALGNFERAAAVMQAISSSTMPPGTEVINSSRGTDLSFTNKVVIHFDSSLTTNPWSGIPLTQKALTEPALNHWLGSLLDDPSKIRCTVMAVDKEGNILTRADATEIKGIVSLHDLRIQPIDFIYLIRNKLESSGTSELETRIRYVFAQSNSLTDDTIVKIVFSDSGAAANLSVKSFGEILPFANYLRDLISGSRPLVAKDFEPASKILTVSKDNPNNINWNELLNRAQNIFTYYDNLLSQLTTDVNDAVTLKTPAATDALRATLKTIADAGYVYAFPQSSFGSEQAQIDILATQGNSVIQRLNDVKEAYNKALVKVNDVNTKVDQKVSLLTDMAKSFLGDDYVVLPKFNFNNTTEVSQANVSRDDLLNYAKNVLKIPLPVNEWLHGVSLVRSKIHTLEMVRLLNDTFNNDLLEISPLQLPYRNNDTWLAVEFKEGTTIDHDTLSIIQYNPQGFSPAKEQCGLLIDEWIEIIPNKKEVTGITFNYNQPNSVPPQAILLTVTPEQTGNWKWDNLVASIQDTFARAKRRAIEPDHVDLMNGISTLLPATLTEFTTGVNGISLDYSLIITAVLNEVTAIQFNRN